MRGEVGDPGIRSAPEDQAASTQPPTKVPHESTVDRVWNSLSSMRLALVLIFGIALLSFVGAVITQAPVGMTTTSSQYLEWLQRVRPRYGALTDLISGLQLFTVATSIWMRLLLGLLAVSTFVCTLNRWPRIWRSVFDPPVKADASVLAGLAVRRDAILDLKAEPEVPLATALANRGYRVLIEDEDSGMSLYADRYRYARLGTLVAHLALVGILAGTVASSLMGFRDPEFTVPEGSTRDVGFGTQLSVRVEAFVDEYYPEGGPKDYRSDVILFDGNVPVARQWVRVNEPLSYGGVRFHQSFFGPAVVLRIADSGGNVIVEDGVPLDFSMGGSSMGQVTIPRTPYQAVVIGPSTTDPLAGPKPGQVQVHLFRDNLRTAAGTEVLTLGQPKAIGDLTFTFVRERQFTGLLVVNDPGAPIIWVTSALLVLGMAATLYFPFPRVWARYQRKPDGTLATTVAGSKGRWADFDAEMDGIVGEAYGPGAFAAPEPPKATRPQPPPVEQRAIRTFQKPRSRR